MINTKNFTFLGFNFYVVFCRMNPLFVKLAVRNIAILHFYKEITTKNTWQDRGARAPCANHCLHVSQGGWKEQPPTPGHQDYISAHHGRIGGVVFDASVLDDLALETLSISPLKTKNH